MQFLKKLNTHKYFLLFIFLFGYAHSVQIRFLIRQKLNGYLFTPEAAVMTFISSCFFFYIMTILIKKWQKATFFSISEVVKIFSISLLIYIIILKAFGFIIALLFDTVERNFNLQTITHSLVTNFIDAFIYGSFFLAYYYHLKNKKYQNQLTSYSLALSESKINQLKTQLNPHFLFNNLNILDQLIEEDKNKASTFLNEFAEIYRYLLEVSTRNKVTITEELSFIKKYFLLIEHKYGNAFQLIIEENKDIQNTWIPPLAIQLLLENAIKHNLGTEKKPIIITIQINESVIVTNNLNKKKNKTLHSGRGLQNLNEQYAILCNKRIEITETETNFIVILPLISNHSTNENSHY
ncbi:sensor histidine kinase [Flavobacterium sp. J27]|uniref:sensor histidine kinase n=1 Tax=Flavobacterium sp. J27 TaxID=2060419 RepID=UPI00102F6D7D|nr:histidine kinase [Flavobacterium sp. J27]